MIKNVFAFTSALVLYLSIVPGALAVRLQQATSALGGDSVLAMVVQECNQVRELQVPANCGLVLLGMEINGRAIPLLRDGQLQPGVASCLVEEAVERWVLPRAVTGTIRLEWLRTRAAGNEVAITVSGAHGVQRTELR